MDVGSECTEGVVEFLYEMIRLDDANLMILAVAVVLIVIGLCVTVFLLVYFLAKEKTKRQRMIQDSLNKLIESLSNRTSSLPSEVSTGNGEKEEYRRLLEKKGINKVIDSGLNAEKKESVFMSWIQALIGALIRKKED